MTTTTTIANDTDVVSFDDDEELRIALAASLGDKDPLHDLQTEAEQLRVAIHLSEEEHIERTEKEARKQRHEDACHRERLARVQDASSLGWLLQQPRFIADVFADAVFANARHTVGATDRRGAAKSVLVLRGVCRHWKAEVDLWLRCHDFTLLPPSTKPKKSHDIDGNEQVATIMTNMYQHLYSVMGPQNQRAVDPPCFSSERREYWEHVSPANDRWARLCAKEREKDKIE